MPRCVILLSSDLRNQMEAELIVQGDPRTLGKGDIFDKYPYIKNRKKKKPTKPKKRNQPSGVLNE